MGGKRRGKKKQQIASSEEPAKNSSTCINPNPNDEWETYTEQQLENIIREKLDHLYRDALSRLLSIGYDEDLALKLLLDGGYCIGIGDCLSNIVLNSMQFLTQMVEIDPEAEEEEEDQPQPFLNLELLMEFNLQFMVYILQKYRPNLNRQSACRYILMNDLNLNRAILMDVNDTTEMLSNLNLDDNDDINNVDKDKFLALEIKEMLDNLDVIDDSISEDTKDMMIANSQKMIDTLEEKLKERIKWASKKVAQARTKQASPKMNLIKEIQIFHEYSKTMLSIKESKVSSLAKELDDTDFFYQNLRRNGDEIKAEISSSKLIVSENMEKCLELSTSSSMKKKNKKWEKEIVKLEEETAMEKEKISKWEQKLVEIEADIKERERELRDIMKERDKAISEMDKEVGMTRERWSILQPMVNSVHSEAYKKLNITMDSIKVITKEEVHAKSLVSILSKKY